MLTGPDLNTRFILERVTRTGEEDRNEPMWTASRLRGSVGKAFQRIEHVLEEPTVTLLCNTTTSVQQCRSKNVRLDSYQSAGTDLTGWDVVPVVIIEHRLARIVFAKMILPRSPEALHLECQS
jgi:hypothetical protein